MIEKKIENLQNVPVFNKSLRQGDKMFRLFLFFVLCRIAMAFNSSNFGEFIDLEPRYVS